MAGKAAVEAVVVAAAVVEVEVAAASAFAAVVVAVSSVVAVVAGLPSLALRWVWSSTFGVALALLRHQLVTYVSAQAWARRCFRRPSRLRLDLPLTGALSLSSFYWRQIVKTDPCQKKTFFV